MGLEPGTTLPGGYRLERRLGAGNLGEVWRSSGPRLNRPVAVKVLRSDAGTGPAELAGFRRAAQLSVLLQNPGITTVHDLGTHQGRRFVVMEFVDGKDLQAVLVRDTAGLAVRRALSLAAEVAEILAAAHAGGVVHGDLKPANLMVQEGGHVKICDFGTAGLRRAGAVVGDAMYGSPAYAAPERWRGEPATSGTDLYALGCLLYALLTGRPPFQPLAAAQLEGQHLTKEVPRPGTGRSDIPKELDELTVELLAKDPGERPANGRVLAARLRAIGDRLDRDDSPAATPLTVEVMASVGLGSRAPKPVLPNEVSGGPGGEYRRAAEQGDSTAMWNLGFALDKAGREQEAEEWFRSAADLGNTNGMCSAGVMRAKAGDSEGAEEWYRKSAGLGNAHAGYLLGRMLAQFGRSGEAEEWYRMAAEKGHADATYNLGLTCHRDGRAEEAKKWFLKSAEMGDSYGMWNLGIVLDEAGQVEEADQWFRKAAAKGNTSAMTSVGVLLGRAGDTEGAKKWYLKAAGEGHAHGMYNLGVLAEQAGDFEEARRWFRQASEKGHSQAKNRLASLRS